MNLRPDRTLIKCTADGSLISGLDNCHELWLLLPAFPGKTEVPRATRRSSASKRGEKPLSSTSCPIWLGGSESPPAIWRVLFQLSRLKVKTSAHKRWAKCQKQPWQQPCNLIVSHEETFRQFVSPSHEQTDGLKWPRPFSWKNKVGNAQNSFGPPPPSEKKHSDVFCCFVFFKLHVLYNSYTQTG